MTKTRYSRALAATGASTALLACSLAAASAASAATIDGAITSAEVVQSSADAGSDVQIDLAWSVPDDSRAGDTFTLQLPPELLALTQGFALTDADGAKVAEASLSPEGLATFTLTDYVTTHPLSVHGTAHFWAEFQTTQTGTTVPITFTGDGGVTFDDGIEATGVPGIDRTAPSKAGAWTDLADQGMTHPQGALQWTVASPRGPFSSLVFDDPAQPGQEVDCTSPILVRHTSTADADGFLTDLVPVDAGDYTVDGTAQQLTVTMGRAVADGEIVQVKFQNSVTDPSLDVYRNTLSVTADGESWSTPGSVRRLSAGGEGAGTGVGQLAITKTVEGAGTPTGPFAVVVDCQWAGESAPDYPRTLTFTGAETQTLTAPVSSVCTATETESGGAASVAVGPAATVTDEAAGTAEIVVTNTFPAAPPVDPADPGTPADPGAPADPGTPGTPAHPAAPADPSAGSLATTGGSTSPWVLTGGTVLALIGAGLVAAHVARTRRAR